jgi:hypothetical protein
MLTLRLMIETSPHFGSRIREELATQSTETSNLTNKLDREIHTLKTQLEAAKYDVIKYCIGKALWSIKYTSA